MSKFPMHTCPFDVAVQKCSVGNNHEFTGAVVSIKGHTPVLINNYDVFVDTYGSDNVTPADVCYSLALYAISQGVNEI